MVKLVDTFEYPPLKNRLQSKNLGIDGSNNIFLYVDAKNTKYVLICQALILNATPKTHCV